jgi:hypothetical protein
MVGCGGEFGSGATGGNTSTGGNPSSGGATGTGGSPNGGSPSGGTGGGVTVDYRACAANSECVLRSESCCGACGVPARGDVISLNVNALGAYTDSVCGTDPACPACAGQVDPTLVATCTAGRCEVVDLTTSPLTTCTTDAACAVRTIACCECGGPMDPASLIALNHDMAVQYAALVCDANSACPDCAPLYPPEAMALCDSGRCIMVWAVP